MVQIEYAPNSRSKCKGCFGKIPVGNVRVSAKEQAHRGRGYVNKYFHGECYTGRKDFTKFYGFTNLRVEDQTRFLSEAQKKRLCPAPETDQASSSSQQPPAKKAKTAAVPVAATPAPNPKVLPPVNGTKMGGDYLFTIVGRKYSTETITPGRSVKLTREPNNPYDSNAIRVGTFEGGQVGHLKKEQAAAIAPIFDRMGESITALATITSTGDVYTAPIRVQLYKLAEETKQPALDMTGALDDGGAETAPTSKPSRVSTGATPSK